MIGLVLNVVAATVLVIASIFRPGFGIGIALVLGRHTFPDRETPIAPLGPIVCAAALFGYWISGRRLRLSPYSVAGVALTGLVVLVGAYRSTAYTNETIRMLADDKALFLASTVAPLLLLSGTLTDRDIRTDFFRSLVAVATGLTTIMLLTNTGERSGALGGGPITLATAIGIALIVLIHFHDPLLGPELQRFESGIRIVVGGVLALGMWMTQSRQPMFSLVLILGIAAFLGLSQDIRHASSAKQLKRIRRLRLISLVMVVGAGAGLAQLVFGGAADTRFALLANPVQEFERSRNAVWEAGMEMARQAGAAGNGFGATVLSDGPTLVLYPHNIFLELWAEIGPVMSLVIYLAFFLGAITAVRKGNRVFTILAGYALLGAQFSGDLYNSRSFYLFLVAALTVPPAMRALSTEHQSSDDAADSTSVPIRGGIAG